MAQTIPTHEPHERNTPMNHFVVAYTVTDTEGDVYCSTQTFHGQANESEVREAFWRQNLRAKEFLAPNAKTVGIQITDINQR